MILTLTPNPSVDRTVSLTTALQRGEVQKISTVLDQPGGKGVNISRAAVAAEVPTVAVLPARDDDEFVTSLRDGGVTVVTSTPAGAIRMNITVTEPDGTTTKLNAPGATLSPTDVEALAATVVEQAAGATWVVLAGSLPPGAPATFYADLCRALRDTGARVAVDTSGAPLAALVADLADAQPDLMKPNGEELASLTGDDADALEADPVAAARAARVLVDRGARAVLASLGGNGAVLVNADGAWHASPPPTTVVSTVGAGDSSLFGHLLADLRGLDAPGRLTMSVAYGSAAAALPGTTVPTPTQVRPDLVSVSALGGWHA
ncbi:1-phosphofructokinase family hexose kinase [Nocardioides yefusunii]|uniref:1-phosphofructokinase family hexose kinase n=1 Tax=Nocardioides yefusunii TaxID=2500546 RepID=A0ABW1QZX4_9ACTN|nr:1-phosphofructokinase family hexose kinase [Nocardioides yefusunii]